MNNREITEKTLAKADSFRVQVQLHRREDKILQGGVYNWIASECREDAQIIRDSQDTPTINVLKKEFRRIVRNDPTALDRLYAFLKTVIFDKKILMEAHSIIADIIK